MSQKLKIDVPFARVGKYDGNLVFNRNNIPSTTLSSLLENGYEFNGQTLKLDLGTDADRDEFMRNHGRHVGKIILKSKVF